MTWSTPACSKRSRYSRTCSGVTRRASQACSVTGRQFGSEPFLAQGGLDLRGVALGAPSVEVLTPHVRRPRPVLPEDVGAVPKRVAEEVAAFEAAIERRPLVGVAHHLGHAGNVRVDGETDGDATLCESLLVVRHPLVRLFGIDEGERQRADALLGRQEDGVAPGARHPRGGCGRCIGLGTTFRGGICTKRPSTPLNGVSVMHRSRDL